MKRKNITAAALAAAMLLSIAAPTAYAEDMAASPETAVEAAEIAEAEEVQPVEAETSAQEQTEPDLEVQTQKLETYDESGDIEISEANFPDENFRGIISGADYDTDQNGKLSADEIAAITYLNFSTKRISSLKGIEFFTSLTTLICSAVDTLDVSKNTELVKLDCTGSDRTGVKLSSLDVSNNTKLVELVCRNNQISSLDLSKNVALTTLRCVGNSLYSLDLSNNTKLVTLDCRQNQISSLDLSKNVELESLDCSDNKIGALDLSKNVALTLLCCASNSLDSLDVSKNTALTDLICNKNYLKTLDVSKNLALKMLVCTDNKIKTIDLSKNTALNSLNCANNQLTSLDINKNTALAILDCGGNSLSTLDTNNNVSLNELHCENNQLTELDVSKHPNLRLLGCSGNKLTEIDIKNNTNLRDLYCDDNELVSLDLSINSWLNNFSCIGNKLTSLDLSNNLGLQHLRINNNPLYALNLESNEALINLLTVYGEETSEFSTSVKTGFVQNGTTWQLDLKPLVGNANIARITPVDSNGLYDSTTGIVTFASRPEKWTYKFDTKAVIDIDYTVELVNTTTATATPTVKPTAKPTTAPTTAPTAAPTAVPTAVPTAAPTAVPTAVPTTVPTAIPTIEPTSTPKPSDTEGTTGFVDRLYSVCLSRDADAAGQADWVKQLTSYQISGTKAAYGFIFSQEFTNKNYSNADYVEHLYEAFMGRASDEGGKADWVSKLDAGASREEVFNGFANSVEFDNICKSYGIVSKDIETFVTRLYSVCLDRQPDDAGLADWAGRLRSGSVTGKAAASGFVFSEEFTNKNYSNADYVEHLYAAFMGRASDEAGKTDWVSKLDAGTSREEVFNGFADSAEFDAICTSYGIVRG